MEIRNTQNWRNKKTLFIYLSMPSISKKFSPKEPSMGKSKFPSSAQKFPFPNFSTLCEDFNVLIEHSRSLKFPTESFSLLGCVGGVTFRRRRLRSWRKAEESVCCGEEVAVGDFWRARVLARVRTPTAGAWDGASMITAATSPAVLDFFMYLPIEKRKSDFGG